MNLESKISSAKETFSNIQKKAPDLLLTFLGLSGIFASGLASGSIALRLYYEAEMFNQNGNITMPGYLIPATAFIAGRLMDIISTREAFKLISRANISDDFTEESDEKDSSTTFGTEFNPFLPRLLTEKDLVSKKMIAMTSVFEVLGIILPPVGIGVGVGSLTAAVSNEIGRRRLQRKLMLPHNSILSPR